MPCLLTHQTETHRYEAEMVKVRALGLLGMHPDFLRQVSVTRLFLLEMTMALQRY